MLLFCIHVILAFKGSAFLQSCDPGIAGFCEYGPIGFIVCQAGKTFTNIYACDRSTLLQGSVLLR
jgi:hypothetical protein